MLKKVLDQFIKIIYSEKISVKVQELSEEELIYDFFKKILADIKSSHLNNYPNSDIYVNSDNEIFFEYNKENKILYVSYKNIWNNIKMKYNIENDKIIYYIKKYVVNHLNVDVELIETKSYCSCTNCR